MFNKIYLQLKKDKFFAFAIITITLIVLLIIASCFISTDPNKINIYNKLEKPTISHIFGTDDLGRDYFSRALYGGRISLTIGIVSMIISIVLGTLVGVLSGYIGGKLDNFLMRLLDFLMSIPSFLVLIVLNSYLKPSISTIIIIIGLLSWMDVARIVRGETINIKQNEYFLAAEALGLKPITVIFKYVIYNLKSVILVSASLNVANAILTESALSFLGLGIQLPLASWGNMLQDAQKHIFDNLYLAIFPGLLIFLTILSLTIISDKLNDNLNIN